MALSEKSPYPRSLPDLGQLVVRPLSLTRAASVVGTDLRAVRHRRRSRFRRHRPTPGAALRMLLRMLSSNDLQLHRSCLADLGTQLDIPISDIEEMTPTVVH